MKANKIVLILPASFMAALFIFGYLSLGQTEEMSNEELQSAVSFTQSQVNETEVTIQWQWADFPADGIRGDDYIEIVLSGSDTEAIGEYVDRAVLELHQADDIIESHDNWHMSEEGIVMAFPNTVENETIFGPTGEITVHFTEPVEADENIGVRYYHTWEDHNIRLDEAEPVNMEQLIERENLNDYWMIERS